MTPRRVLLAIVLMALPRVAEARHEANFAHFLGVAESEVKDVVGYLLPPGHNTHLLVGKLTRKDVVQDALVIMRCTSKQCTGRAVRLELGAKVQLLGLVDLEGTPGAISGRPEMPPGYRGQDKRIEGKRMKFPALVVKLSREEKPTQETRGKRQVEGTHHEETVLLLSLRKSDQPGTQLLLVQTRDIYPSGAGNSTWLSLVKGKGKVLDVLAHEQSEIERTSHCMRPKPYEYRLIFEKVAYVRKDLERGPRGCGSR